MNEKKMALISVLLIIGITFIFLISNSSINFNFEENTLTGRAIETEEIEFEERSIRNISYYEEEKKCESVCPLGFEIINSTCSEINSSCKGKVICGLYENGTLVNIDNGHCATLNVVPTVSR